ncbi:MAG: hypothetical protein WCZ89_06970 [Phycisphaerae bacterium]
MRQIKFVLSIFFLLSIASYVAKADTNIQKHTISEQAIGNIDHNSSDPLLRGTGSGDSNATLNLDDTEEDNYEAMLKHTISLIKYFL